MKREKTIILIVMFLCLVLIIPTKVEASTIQINISKPTIDLDVLIVYDDSSLEQYQSMKSPYLTAKEQMVKDVSEASGLFEGVSDEISYSLSEW